MARVLVLGGYGLIGSKIAQHLRDDGHSVKGLGRSRKTGSRVLPDLSWLEHDVAELTMPEHWEDVLTSTDFVVNCAGALQPSGQDNLEAVHHHAIAALAVCCAAKDVGLIQISAVRASEDASTEFLASKGRGDAAIRQAAPRYWIFRPGLVISDTGYGGTQLLRMLAAFPLVQPVAFGASRIQTVSVHDVARMVGKAIAGELPSGRDIDLVEAEAHSLTDVIRQVRHWLGFPAAIFTVPVPGWLVWPVTRMADGLGLLGWRSPLRRTAIAAITEGVTGEAVGQISSLRSTLASMPARFEDRVSARMMLLMPFVVATLSLFWLASGLIGIARLGVAADTLTAVGWTPVLAKLAVLFWALVDIGLAGLILIRRHARLACLLMIVVSMIYLISASVLTPFLWLDPLGPLVKTIPAILLAFVARSLLETR